MAANELDKKEIWLELVQAALDKYELPEEMPQADGGALDDLMDDMTYFARGIADQVLDDYEEKFGGGRGARRRKKRDRDADPDDD